MKTGLKGTVPICVALCAIALGCTPPEPVSQDDSERRIAEMEVQTEDLRTQTRELQDRNAIQADRIDELENRNRRLTDLINDLQFENKMLRRHVDALAPAPRERDRLSEENEQLRRELEQLRLRLGQPPQTQTSQQ